MTKKAPTSYQLLKPVVDECIEEGQLELPTGWLRVNSENSILYRPRSSTMPSVKVHYTPMMVDVDYKQGRKICSKRYPCKHPQQLLDVLKNQLYEWG